MQIKSAKELNVYKTGYQHGELVSLCQETGKMLGSMINNPGPFLISGF